MARGKPSSTAYDDDDYDDGYDDECYDEEEGEGWEAEQGGYRNDKSTTLAEECALPAGPASGSNGVVSYSAHTGGSFRKDGEAARDIATVSARTSGSTGRGEGDSEGDKWTCGACTFDNVASFLACEICSTPRVEGGSLAGIHATNEETPGHPPPPIARSDKPVHIPQQTLGAPVVPIPSSRKEPGSITAPQVAKRVSLGSCSGSEASSEANATAPNSAVNTAVTAHPAVDGSQRSSARVVASATSSSRATTGAHQEGRTVIPLSKGGTNANRRTTVATTDLSTGIGSLQVGGRAVKEKGGGGEAGSGRRVEGDVRRVSDGGRDSVGGRESMGGGESALRMDKEEEERRKAAVATEREERRRAALKEYEGEEWVKVMGEREKEEGEKPTLHLIVLGHVDAGKSTLMGHLLHRLGRVTARDMHKHKKEAQEQGKASFAFAWVLDESKEERERGVTTSVAVSHFETEKFQVVLLDAPGHRDFVPSMIAGAAQADAAILVIDATPGAFESGMGTGQAGQDVGQTKEHAQLARSLGVDQLAVVVNKMDAVAYERTVFEGIKRTLAPFLARQCGFREGSVRWLAISGLLGVNLDARPAGSDCPLADWYSGPTLLEAIDSFSPPSRPLLAPLRVSVSEVIRSRSLGAVAVAGKVEAGALRVNMRVTLMPGSYPATVKALESNGKPVKQAAAGESVDIGLHGVEANQLLPGGALCHPDHPIPVATRIEAQILTAEIKIPILRGSQVVLHAHAASEPARVTTLLSLIDPRSGTVVKNKPRALTSNQTALVEVTIDRGMCLEAYADFRAFGRITLRDCGRTVAMGVVKKILRTSAD